MDNIVEIYNMKKRYKGFLLDNISFAVPEGSIMGLIGPNGAGKTTIIKILMNMIRANSGNVKIFGVDHSKNEKAIKNRIGYVGEDQFYYGDKTVAWTGDFVSGFFDQWDKNKFQKFMTDFAISRTKKISELSKGMKVKFSLAVALSHNPDLILLDEPTAGLDPIIRREVLEILRGLTVDENKSAIISSHITDDISRIADYVTFLIEGKIKLSGAKDEILSLWKRIHYKDGALDKDIIDSLKNRKKHMFGQSGVSDRYPELKDSLARGLARSWVLFNGLLALVLGGLALIGLFRTSYTTFLKISMVLLVFLQMIPLLLLSSGKMQSFVAGTTEFLTTVNWLIWIPVGLAVYFGLMLTAIKVKDLNLIRK